jgi:hypothetical protein
MKSQKQFESDQSKSDEIKRQFLSGMISRPDVIVAFMVLHYSFTASEIIVNEWEHMEERVKSIFLAQHSFDLAHPIKKLFSKKQKIEIEKIIKHSRLMPGVYLA